MRLVFNVKKIFDAYFAMTTLGVAGVSGDRGAVEPAEPARRVFW